MRVTLFCPSCRHPLRVTEEQHGKKVTCLQCGNKFVAKVLEDAGDADSEAVAAGVKPARPRRRDEDPGEEATHDRPWYLFLPVVLPFGIPVLTLGGGLWLGLAGGLAAACLGIARKDTWSVGGRLAASLGLVLSGYAFTGFFLFAIFYFFGGRDGGESQVDNTPATKQAAPPSVPKPAPPLPQPEPVVPPPPPPVAAAEFPLEPGGRIFRPYTRPVTGLGFSPDGKTLAVGGNAFVSPTEGVSLVDAATLSVRQRFDGGGPIAFTPDGKGLIYFRNMLFGVRDLGDARDRPGEFQGDRFALAPDGRVLVTNQQAMVHWWDAAQGTRLGAPGPFIDSLRPLAFSPDGKTLAAAGHSQDTVTFFDVATRARGETVSAGSMHGIVSLAYVADGKLLAASWHTDIGLIDPVAKKVVRKLLFMEPIEILAASPDGAVLAGGGAEGIVRCWDVATGQERAVLRGGTPNANQSARAEYQIYSLAFSPDGKYLAAGSQSGHVRVWETAAILGGK